MSVSLARELRDAFGRFATGVTVVTTREPDGTPRGFTANSFTSVSLDPPLLLICVAKTAHSCDVFAASDHFTVNILADSQKDVSGLFASRSSDKFENAHWHNDAQNMPLIDDALVSFSCANHQVTDAGDHLILIGRVLEFETNDGNPLGYYKGGYFEIGVDRAVTDVATAGGVTLGAVLERERELLLACAPNGEISLPAAQSISDLVQSLGSQGLKPDLSQLFAVYQVAKTGTQRIVYRGDVTGAETRELKFYDIDTLPLSRVSDEAERSLLQRYAKEKQLGSFGIYQGTEVEGVVHSLAGHHKYHI